MCKIFEIINAILKEGYAMDMEWCQFRIWKKINGVQINSRHPLDILHALALRYIEEVKKLIINCEKINCSR